MPKCSFVFIFLFMTEQFSPNLFFYFISIYPHRQSHYKQTTANKEAVFHLVLLLEQALLRAETMF